jgi:hypothetical protein
MKTAALVGCVCVLQWLAWPGCATVRWESQPHKVRVQTTPAGAQVWYQDQSGQHSVGKSPIDLERDVRVGYWEFNPWMWLAAAVSAGAFAGTTTWAVYAPETDDLQQGFAIGLAVVAGLAALVTVPGAILGQVQDGDQVRVEEIHLDVGADLPGHKGAHMQLTLPSEQESISLLLHRTEEPGAFRVPGLIGKLPAERQPPVVAVFDIHDAGGRLGRAELEQLTAHLTACLTEARKARVIPREQLRERLRQEKSESYRTCFEESCQIELGRAVAAEKSLSSTLIRVGKKCALTVNLFDLKTETAEQGASVASGCAVDDLMGAIRQVADKL